MNRWGRFPVTFRHHVVCFLGEFVGTFLFIFFAFAGTQTANIAAGAQLPPGIDASNAPPNASSLLYVALAFGFSLGINVWIFYRISGGLFNPAVTFGMCFIGALTWTRGLVVFMAQMIGSIASAGLVSCLFPGPMLVQTKLGPGTSTVRGLFIEMFLTAELVFTVFMLAKERHRATFLAPIGIGLALFIAELSGVYYTGGSLNPARSFAPNVVLASFPGSHWIYWLGPLLGSLLAVGLYKIVKILNYESVNPDQDSGGNFGQYTQERNKAIINEASTIRGPFGGDQQTSRFSDMSQNSTVAGGPVSGNGNRNTSDPQSTDIFGHSYGYETTLEAQSSYHHKPNVEPTP